MPINLLGATYIASFIVIVACVSSTCFIDDLAELNIFTDYAWWIYGAARCITYRATDHFRFHGERAVVVIMMVMMMVHVLRVVMVMYHDYVLEVLLSDVLWFTVLARSVSGMVQWAVDLQDRFGLILDLTFFACPWLFISHDEWIRRYQKCSLRWLEIRLLCNMVKFIESWSILYFFLVRNSFTPNRSIISIFFNFFRFLNQQFNILIAWSWVVLKVR